MFGHKKKKNVDMLKALPFGRAARSNQRRRRFWRVLLVVLGAFVVLGLVLSPFAYAGWNAYQYALVGKEYLESAEESINALDLAAAESQSRQAAQAFAASRAEADKLRWLMPLPLIGQRLAAADRLLMAGELSSTAIAKAVGVGRQVLEAVSDTGQLLPGQLIPPGGLSAMTAEDKRRALAALASSAPQMRQAKEDIDEALDALDNLPIDPLIAPYSERLSDARDKLETTGLAIDAVLPAVETLPQALGYPTAQRYLFFFQNNTEMRPTGGFLGLVGQATIKDGDIESIEVDDTYAYDAPSETVTRPSAPAPLQQYVGVKQWYLRDANWSPDFTVSAPRMEQFFREEALVKDGVQPAAFDGVVAITPDLAEDLLRLTGPITVDGIRFDADNLVDELEFQVEMAFADQGIPRSERKAVVGKLMRQAIDKAIGFSLPQLIDLLATVRRNLDEGDILLFAKDADLQELILENDWGGKLREVRGDYLTVIDANLASLKTDPAVDRHVKYVIRPDTELGGYRGEVSVTYTNHGSFTWKTTRYRTYTRVYLPLGSKLIGVDGAMKDDKLKNPAGEPGQADQGQELGRQWFGAFISTEPGQSNTLTFRFRLARSIEANLMADSYYLIAERQPGSAGHRLTLDLDFGKKLAAAVPGEKPENYGDSRYSLETDLKLDREFKVSFGQSSQSDE